MDQRGRVWLRWVMLPGVVIETYDVEASWLDGKKNVLDPRPYIEKFFELCEGRPWMSRTIPGGKEYICLG